jgi:hypothetical protein
MRSDAERELIEGLANSFREEAVAEDDESGSGTNYAILIIVIVVAGLLVIGCLMAGFSIGEILGGARK